MQEHNLPLGPIVWHVFKLFYETINDISKMKKQTLGIITSIIVICQLNVNTLFAQKAKIVPFNDLKIEVEQKMNFPDLKLELKIDTQQPVYREGLKFTIIITNRSSKELDLYNPLDMSTLVLNNEMGIPVSVDRSPLFIAKYARFYVPNFESFDVGKTFLNGKMVNIDFYNTENIKLPANSSLEMNLSIANVLTNPRLRRKPDAPKSKIAKGKYSLTLTTMISSVRSSKEFFLKTMETPEVTVLYGQ